MAMTMQLRFNEEYQKLIRDLTHEEYTELKADIQKERKIYVPIVINKHNIVLDGHHRCKIANELGITPIPTKTVEFKDVLDEKEYVINSNLHRRQLSVYDRAFLANELLKIKQERLRLSKMQSGRKTGRRGSNKRKTPRKPYSQRRKHESRHKAAKQHGISETTLRKYQTIIGSAPSKEKAEELKHKLQAGQTTINKEYSSIKKEERKQALRNAESLIDFSSDDIDLKYGDFIERSKEIPNNSVDLIFTDPPYAKTADNDPDLYEEVAKMASRVLKPGGSLVLYAAQHKLPDILDVMRVDGLTYWWILAVKHQGASARMHGQHVFIGWKPLLWFVKGTKLSTTEYLSDFIESKVPPKHVYNDKERDPLHPDFMIAVSGVAGKQSHEWEQSTEEAKYIISQLCPVENQIVLDPMLGAGTTGRAAKIVGRKFIGIEKDPIALDKARKNILESSAS